MSKIASFSLFHQAAGNQVKEVADELGISVGTIISGTANQPDFECSIVSTGPIGSKTDDNLASSGLYALDITVEQVVYVTANRTLSLGEVTSVVENGFNRGRGGRNRFRSLLQAETVFSTVDNVEVLQGSLTRFPTSSPTHSKIPTNRPSAAPTGEFSLAPSVKPTTSATPLPTPDPTLATSLPSQAPFSDSPTESDTENTAIPGSLTPGSTAKANGSDEGTDDLSALAIIGMVAGILLCAVASLCTIYVFQQRSRDEGQRKKHLNASTQAPQGRDRDERAPHSKIPNHLVLNDDNQSLANTTLGDQTAGGLARKYQQPFKQPVTKKIQTGDGDVGQGEIPRSFDDNSLYTTHLAPPSLTETGPTESSKGTTSSNYHSNFSNSNSSLMLPPSVLPFDDEEEEDLFSGRDLASASSRSSFCSTIAESGAVDSSLISESVTSSSIEPSSVRTEKPFVLDRGVFPIEQEGEDEEDPFGVDLFATSGRALTQKTKTNDEHKAKLASQELEKEDKAPSAFFPFMTGSGSSQLKLKFDTEEDPSRYGANVSSFRSTEDDIVTSGASPTPSLIKDVDSVLLFGMQSPSEASYHQYPLIPFNEEEEKREIDYETRDEVAETEGLRDGAKNPLVDLLADTTLLDRSASPSSWHSWMITKDNSSGRAYKIAAPSSAMLEESKTSSNDGIGLGHIQEQYGRQFKADKVEFSQPVGQQHFLPIQEDDPSKDSSTSEHGNETTSRTKTNARCPDMVSPATSELSSSSLKEDGTGILGVQPRQDAAALMLDDQVSIASSTSTGLSNPWLYDAVEQNPGSRSTTADAVSLSGRSRRSQRSNASSKSRLSRRSNRSFNVPPSEKYKGRGPGRIRSAAASIASYRSSNTTQLAPDLELTPLERKLAALHHKEKMNNDQPSALDQVTASSMTLSSVGAKSLSTFSSKLTHTGANKIRRMQMRITVEVPPGKLDIVLSDRHDQRGTVIFEVRENSGLRGMLSPGDQVGKLFFTVIFSPLRIPHWHHLTFYSILCALLRIVPFCFASCYRWRGCHGLDSQRYSKKDGWQE